MRVPHETRQSGFTLVEAVFSMVVTGGLVVTIAYAAEVTIGRGEAGQNTVDASTHADLAVNEIERSVRWSEEVSQASADLLTLTTRYTVDLDDQAETVRYTRSGTTLYREVAHGASAFDPAEVVLENVVTFWTSALTIADEFDNEDYAGPVPEGNTPSIDGSIQTKYKLIEMGQVDPDLKTSYDPTAENLNVVSTSLSGKTITVSPPLARTGLSIEVDFTPTAVGEFRPVIYGNETPESDGVWVLFADDQSIRLRVTVGSVLMDEVVAPFTYTPLEKVTIRLTLEEERASAWIKGSGGTQDVGTVNNGVGSLENRPVHLQTYDIGVGGIFDDLTLGYRYVDVKLGVQNTSEVLQFYGGATRRLP